MKKWCYDVICPCVWSVIDMYMCLTFQMTIHINVEAKQLTDVEHFNKIILTFH